MRPSAHLCTPHLRLALAIPLAGLAGCGGTPAPTCASDCGPCEYCDTSLDAPVCVATCAEDMVCNADNQCEAPPPVVAPTCAQDCGPCQVCDTSVDTPECVDTCADNMVCNSDNQCEPPVAPTCDIACGPCQICDDSVETPVCIDMCADGMVCNDDGQCDAPVVEPLACEPACGPCQACDISGVAPECLDLCGAGEYCDVAIDECRREPGLTRFHGGFPSLQGPFATGSEVTAQCLTCHETQGAHFLNSAHWNWLGESPQVVGHETGTAIGKKNLVNNFCIGIESNEARCTQCHAGYNYKGPTYDFTNPGQIDCLICHADLSTGYVKEAKTAGNPPPSLDLALVAQSVGRSTADNCGACHFGAGGGDNVKNGDLGSALGGHPTPQVDVHLGAGMTCSDCHDGGDHTIDGAGLHVPVTDGFRVACTDCHWEFNPHELAGVSNGPLLDNHAIDVACQTCHIPAFSRHQPTKVNWDWSTAGNRVREAETTVIAGGATVTSYDYMKGDFVWEQGVRPSYGWYDPTPGTVNIVRMTTMDTFQAGQGIAASDPIRMGYSTATIDDDFAKIYPFKVMTGRQPAHLTDHRVLVPNLFGPGSFWAGIPVAGDYTEAGVRDLWTTSLNKGAHAAGQIGTTDTIGDTDWDFLFTELYLGINHEVAPPSEALGCPACHFGNSDWDWSALGYVCDPASTVTPCSRHLAP